MQNALNHFNITYLLTELTGWLLGEAFLWSTALTGVLIVGHVRDVTTAAYIHMLVVMYNTTLCVHISLYLSKMSGYKKILWVPGAEVREVFIIWGGVL